VGELIAGGRRELAAHFGEPPRFDMRMFPLLSLECPAGVLIPAVDYALREVVAEVGVQFKRETGYDLAPFDPSNPDMQGVLFDSQKFMATFPIAAGAAGFSRVDGVWWMDWVWVHPYERGTGLFRRAWGELEQLYGRFHVEGPYSASMSAFLRNEEVDPGRLNHSLEGGSDT
jgi:hypothetical protein